MPKTYDVIIVGSGPAGIFAALELAESGLRILLLEKGRPLEKRSCPAMDRSISCIRCSPCGMVSGWGGAGAFSDGKLTLSAEVGGRLNEYLGVDELNDLIEYVDHVYLKFGGGDRVFGVGEEVEEWRRRAALAGLRLIPIKIRHLGTERCYKVLQAVYQHLSEKVDMRLGVAATRLHTEDARIAGIELSSGEVIEGKYVVVAPGREGADWLLAECRRLGLSLKNNPVDVGVRVEVPSAILEEITSVLYESKMELYSKVFDDRIRTFCMCPHGEVTTELTAGADPVVTVNGHSYADKRTDKTNFALLVSTTFTEPFNEPIAYGRYIARLANILSGGVIVQRLGDLLSGRRSTPERINRGIIEPSLKGATPGDLSFVLPYRYLTGILEMLQAMDNLAPGIYSRHTLLYGVEVKFYSARLELNDRLETEIKNLFAAGDGAGVTRGLIQASASGVIVARSILRDVETAKQVLKATA
ncbi:MAG: NAD(P)/FAD-dependent oxidoreductase [Chloroflexi bacterium]|nr:NAD(P)/FAD-dependent oxidoreductase [Chloroflexota bacterium]MCL5074406.1 NAD(P)/FAD-dependent oxidoreductase [Chloroflexota bacterium]